MYICKLVCVFACMHRCMDVCGCVHEWMCVYMCVYAYVSVYACVYPGMHMGAFVCMCTLIVDVRRLGHHAHVQSFLFNLFLFCHIIVGFK